MKKLIAVLLVITAILCSFAACGGNKNDPANENQQVNPSENATPATEPQTPAPTTEPTTAPPPAQISLGTAYTTEEYEITFNEVYFTGKCEIQETSYFSHSKEAGDGNILLAVEMTIKNLGIEAVDSWDLNPFEATVYYNEKYKYDKSSYIGPNELEPLSQKTYAMVFEVPEALENATESLVIDFTIDNAAYQYVIR